MVLTVCVLSSNIALVSEEMSYLKQKPFYEQFQSYNFLYTLPNGGLSDGQLQQQLNYEFYKECTENKKGIAQSFFGSETNAIYINKNTLGKIESVNQ